MRTICNRFWVPLLIIGTFVLAACTEELINTVEGDPQPTTEAGEEAIPFDTGKICADCTVAQFSSGAGRIATPEDATLASLNESLTAGGSDALTGFTKDMPIRIPFDGPIQHIYQNRDSNPGQDALVAWAQSLLIFPTSDPSAVIPPWTVAHGGSFKAIYQDDSYDLILVPSSDTMEAGTQYAVVVTKNILDSFGRPVQESTLFSLVKQETPVSIDGVTQSSILETEEAESVEFLRESFEPLLDALDAGGLPRDDIAHAFTFTTEQEDAQTEAIVAQLFAAMQATATDTTGAATTVVTATDVLPVALSTALPAGTPFKTFLEAQSGSSLSAVDKVYRGSYPCQNFLALDATGEWALDLINRATNPGTDCPKQTTEQNPLSAQGAMDFWASTPVADIEGIIVYLHGITRSADDFVGLANTMAALGYGVIAIDGFNHGARQPNDLNGDGVIDGLDSGSAVLRVDRPDLMPGFIQQTLMDASRLTVMLKANSTLLGLFGFTPQNDPSVNFVGQSLGAIFGAMLTSGSLPYDRVVLNVPGGDIADVFFNAPGIGGTLVVPGIAQAQGLAIGSPDLNSTVAGLEALVRHSFFAGLSDPLQYHIPTNTDPAPKQVLMQQITGDTTVPNNNNELLARVMNLEDKMDGDGKIAFSNSHRVRWIIDPSNHPESDGTLPGHGHLLDPLTPLAASRVQLQAACFIANGTIIDLENLDPTLGCQ